MSYVSDNRRKSAVFLPAAGNRNGTNVNNVGSNGNYWSASNNDNNNANNLNFNSDNANMNNNNRNNGQSVRLVRGGAALTRQKFTMEIPSFSLSYEQLLFDLYVAYLDARRHKRNRSYQKAFEAHLEENIISLANDLWNRTYKALPSTCFIIQDPKKREVFAADFRDRIVHHLYYNYTHELYERTFIHDSYSCIKKRGTHFGINRLEQHIRKESLNYTEKCYVLKMDIKGYFMQINRQKLLEICLLKLRKMANHTISKNSKTSWCQVIDFPFIEYLTGTIVLLNPTESCVVRGRRSDWDDLPKTKSLFYSAKDCGLPIGNLTSQLFSNVYLGELDQFIKRILKCRHYGRYVDDFYVVSSNKDFLKSIIQPITQFLQEELCLPINQSKTLICDSQKGVEFLGAYLKPHRKYVSNQCLHRINKKLPTLFREKNPYRIRARLNSYLGIFSHYSSYFLRKEMFLEQACFSCQGYFTNDGLKYVLNECEYSLTTNFVSTVPMFLRNNIAERCCSFEFLGNKNKSFSRRYALTDN